MMKPNTVAFTMPVMMSSSKSTVATVDAVAVAAAAAGSTADADVAATRDMPRNTVANTTVQAETVAATKATVETALNAQAFAPQDGSSEPSVGMRADATIRSETKFGGSVIGAGGWEGVRRASEDRVRRHFSRGAAEEF